MSRSRSGAESQSRRLAWRRGLAAETLAVTLLRLQGYRILARRLRTPVGELDILARRGNTLAAIEVKARRFADSAADALRPRQRQRIERALDWYLAGHPDAAALSVRFDVMLFAPWRPPRHLKDAWRPGFG